MALNHLMHPKNPYRKKPDFKTLSSLYPEFKKHLNEEKGSPNFDFKNPECMKALSWVLLKHDFNLEVDFPLDRLIPTIPLRLNYILWLEDILKCRSEKILAIDIGCGASCVYPLLGYKMNNWSFVATECDAVNYEYAKKNVASNKMSDAIKVIQVDENSSLLDIFRNHAENYTFTMCNPPFYSNNLEAWCGKTRKESRPEPHSVSTASPQESICPGGEINYVKRMIDDSLEIQKEILFYTSMLGKKSSLPILKEYLRSKNILNFGVTEFCQGRTMRWGLGWSFHGDIDFGKAPSKVTKCNTVKKTLQFCIPNKFDSANFQYSVQALGNKIMLLLDALKIVYEPVESSIEVMKIEMVAVQNTWSHQRRKRRLQMSEKDDECKKVLIDESNDNNESSNQDILNSNDNIEGNITETLSPAAVKPSCCDEKAGADNLNSNMNVDDIESYVLKCEICLLKDCDDVILAMSWLGGENKEAMNQVLQYFKNNLS